MLSVSDLVTRVRSAVEADVGSVWVEGEVRNLRVPASGHAYFTLGDGRTQIRAVCFRSVLRALRVDLEDGSRVLAWGRVTVYEPRGELQIVVDILEPAAGLGVLLREFEARKRRLEAEGWFAAERKRPLPEMPRVVGVVTSLAGAALRDILQVLGRRAPGVSVVIAPAAVQGEGAAGELRTALERIGRVSGVDVVILARGGGSVEDLWTFNDEDLVRAVGRCPVPVVTGVGHETDVTLVDFAADVRAPTPSAAAEVAVREWARWAESLNQLADRLHRAARRRCGDARARLAVLESGLRAPAYRVERARIAVDTLAERLEGAWVAGLRTRRSRCEGLCARLSGAGPQVRWRQARDRLENLQGAMERGMVLRLKGLRQRTEAREFQLNALNPYAVLGRGYALVRDGAGRLVRDASRCRVGDPLEIVLAKGVLGAEVTEVRAERPRG